MSDAQTGSPGGEVRLVDVRDQALSVDELLQVVADPAAGGIALFVGTIRADDDGRAVQGLGYTAHPSAADALRDVAAAVAARHDVVAVAAVHRTGHLDVGEIAVVVAVSAAHRGTAFEAARDLIDTLKTTVPIWKLQEFTDGASEWVGLP